MHKHTKNNQTKQDFKPTIILVLTSLSLVFLLLFAWGATQKALIMLAGTSTSGLVTDLKVAPAGFKSTRSYALVVEYKDATGSTKSYESNIYSSPALYKVGEQVPLWYWQDQVLLKSIRMWTNTILSGVFGLFFVSVGYMVKRGQFS
ncbi:MAG: DUF3592 domain-containing protein [Haliscomenobacter sp.]|uniref:DUF3592 domain-containing protein n=1 Tax=Haliscomenobacter sp. TaxID=2717303 RepID=UPI0029B59FFE|nr:DUF3592 domain-containing protein [Haliscomenobacter sp.]MDX2071689.1 DUF3592 domain-containing protein [Haliscomenobacter sp.]